MAIRWTFQKFDTLSVNELYAILQLRNEVFSVEQQCVYQDADNKDQKAVHLCGWEHGALVAYCRLLPAGVSYVHPSIGRVVTASHARGKGYGKLLMEKAIWHCGEIFSDPLIVISAQAYLEKFYSDFGFRPTGDAYLEDGIPHLEMQLSR